MRISDWSSDVCSSDLRFRIKLLGIVRLEGEVEQPFLAMPIVMVGPERDHHATPPGATLLRVDEPADHGAVIVDHMAEIGTEMAGPHVEQPGDPLHRNAQQMGRASWRVRVCQYV